MAERLVYGSYNPLAMLLRTWAGSREALEATLPIAFDELPPKLQFSNWPPKERPDDESLMAVANFIHEYTHYLQTTTRAFPIGRLSNLASQSAWTLDLVRALSDCTNHNAFWPPHLPLAHWVWSSLPRDLCGTWIRKWMVAETTNRIFWGQSFYRREEPFGEHIDDLFRQYHSTHKGSMLELPEPLYPRIQGVDENGEALDEAFILLPQDILENEANVNVFLYLWIWYDSDTAFRITKRLLGPNNTKETFGVAFAWIMQGIGSLFPLAADLAFQGRPHKGSSFKDIHPSWRFMQAWQSCLKFKYCDKDGSFITKYKDIETTICADNEWSTLEEDLRGVPEGGTDVLPLPLECVCTILRHTMHLRIDHPNWFYSPTSYIDYLLHNVPVPFVRFRDYPLMTSWLGPPLCSSDDETREFYSRLFSEVFFMWAGREVATSERIRCPLCEFISEASCTGRCMFSTWFEREWGFPHDLR